MKKTKLSQPVQLALVSIVLFLVFVLGWFLLVSPQHKTAANVKVQIADVQRQIDDARALTLRAKHTEKIRVADIFKLTQAMPDQADEAGIILQLTDVARRTGISFQSITPGAAVALSGYQVVPIQVIFEGDFYNLSDFLYRLRNLVDVRHGALVADGRLFSIDTVTFNEGTLKFPQVKATLQINAYVFGNGSPATSAPAQIGATGPTGPTGPAGPASAAPPGSTTPATATPSVGGASVAGARK